MRRSISPQWRLPAEGKAMAMIDPRDGRTGGDSRVPIITVALCYLIALFEGFDLQSAGVAAPKLGPAFHLKSAELGWFFSSSTFGLMLGAAIGGRLSDRFGRKRVLIASVAVFGLMSVATGLATNFEMLLVARFLTGLGIGGALPNLVALVSENSSPTRKNTSIGALYAGLPSGGAFVSLVAALGKSSDWSMIFFFGGIAPLVAIPLLLFALPESRELHVPRGERADKALRSSIPFALFGDGRAARTLPLWLSFFLALLTMYLLLNWLPTLLVSRGMSKPDASLVQLSFNLFGALASVCTGLMMDRFSLGKVIVGLLRLRRAMPFDACQHYPRPHDGAGGGRSRGHDDVLDSGIDVRDRARRVPHADTGYGGGIRGRGRPARLSRGAAPCGGPFDRRWNGAKRAPGLGAGHADRRRLGSVSGEKQSVARISPESLTAGLEPGLNLSRGIPPCASR
jgi:MFS family permease